MVFYCWRNSCSVVGQLLLHKENDMDGNVITLMLVIFAFVLPIAIYGIWTSHKKDMAQLNQQLSDSDKQRVDNELAAVKKRLEVLEAIVTDKKYQLDNEISSLRVIDK